MARPDLWALRGACLRGDCAAALKALSSSHGLPCARAEDSGEADEAAAAALLTVYAQDGGNTLLHYLCSGEALGLGGGLLLSLARGRSHASGDLWPARHQRGRAQLLVLVLARQPRLALLAGCPNAAGDTPLHAAVLSQSWAVLGLLLSVLEQLLALRVSPEQQQEPAALSGATALQLLLSVENSKGLTPLELAVRLRQWPAVRLLAAAAGGAPPLSQSQLDACSLVQHYLGISGGGRAAAAPAARASSSGAAQGGSGPIHASASGSSVAEAAGRLLSKLWDAWGATPAGAAAADSLLEAVARAGQQPEAGGSGSGSGSDGAAGGSQLRVEALQLQPKALDQAGVLALAQEEQRRALLAAIAAAAASQGSTNADPGPAATPAAPSSSSLRQCIVCYDELPPGGLSVQLPCGHATCDTCWRGVLQACIDEGDPRRAVCPQPGCGTALPLPAATRLLPAAALQRFQQLVAQSYLSTHPHTMRSCPVAACGAMLHLPGPPLPAAHGQKPAAAPTAAAAAAAAAPAEAEAVPAAVAAGRAVVAPAESAQVVAGAAAAPGAGLDAECGACGHLLCWRCGEEAHEPASCEQMRQWGEELAVLRRAAPDADRAWLASNTKRCPTCRAHIQKHGGCNHMTCKACGLHFCWVCGGEWSRHNMETGGYYFCSVRQRADLPEYSGGGGGGGDEGPSWLAGPLAWVAGVWGSIKAAAQQQQLQRHLRQYLRLSGSPAGLHSAAAHMMLLLSAAGVAAAAPAAPAVSGPELLGISSAEARRMGGREWGELVAAAAASAVDAAALPSRLALPVAQAAADAALAAAATGSSNSSSGSGEQAGVAYLKELAAALAAARGLLQHAAVAIYQLPSGPGRRHLAQLSDSIQGGMEQLEPLLLALPEREALPLPAQHPGVQRQATGGKGHDGSGGSGGLAGWLLRKWWGLEPPPAATAAAPEAQPALASLTGAVMLQQLQFAAAVHQQRGAVRAALQALQADLRELRAVARAGLYL